MIQVRLNNKMNGQVKLIYQHLLTVDAELQFARAAFGEKVKELSTAVARVDALTKQLEELKRGNTLNSYQVFTNAVPANSSRLNHEYEKLRQHLLVSIQSLPLPLSLSSSPFTPSFSDGS